MSHVLITGTSGFIGRGLAERMARNHDVVCLSRKETHVQEVTGLRGGFTWGADLRKLDPYPLDVVVHLATVTGGCTEEEGLRVNVLGTHGLLRYALGRGCRKFVLASSIAAVGFQSVGFRPIQLPMPDEHPCLDRDGYGLSNYLMEEVTQYLWRQDGDLDFIDIRLASILDDDREPSPKKAGPLTEWAIGSVSVMYLCDAVRCFATAAEAEHKPGVRIMNAVGTQACVEGTVPDIVRAWYGSDADRLDLSHYERPGNERDPLYDITRIQRELGFVPERSVLPA